VNAPTRSEESPADDSSVEPEGDPRGRRWRVGTVGVALAIVLGLLLGYAAGVLTPRLLAPGDSSPEAGFARDMSTHHAQAVEMGMLAAKNGENSGVRTVGEDIALTQQGQIGMMSAWLRDWGLGPTGDDAPMAWMPDGERSVENGLMPGMATEAEMTTLRNASGPAVDRLFLQLMLRHHLGGIHMAEAAVDQADDDDVRWLAQTMIDGQRKEISVLQQLQSQVA
jgi:uncharacterized protein (DUF305 family)